jgi:predicted permease
MPVIRRLRSAWDSIFRQGRLDRELDDEMRCVVEELTARHVAAGLDRPSARRRALIEVGGVEQVKEQVRRARIGVGIETTLRDVAIAWRLLWKTRGFAAASIATLALGIGATTAIFSVVNALLLQPLPYRDADRLVFVWQDLTDAGYPRAPLAGPELVDLRTRSTLFDGFGGIWANSATLSGDHEPEHLRIGLVTADFFSLLGAEPALGRTFRADDEAQSASPGVVLSWALFERRFGADPSIVGQRIEMNRRPTTVLGVMPRSFRLLLPPDAAVPDDLQAWQLLNASFTRWPRGQQFLRVVGRMKAGATLDAAQQEIAAIAAQVGREFRDYGPSGATFYAVGLHDDGVREVRPALLALFAGVGILLLIACVNVSGLLVTRAAARGPETALRMALGAGRGRLARQCAIEGLVLGVLGGAAGLVVARGGLALLLAARPATLSRIDAAGLDPAVLAFAAAVAVTWGVLFSLAPLAEMFRSDLAAMIQRRGRQASPAPVRYSARAALVVVQIALSVALLVGAGLLVRAFERLQRVDAGFRADGVLTFRIPLSAPRYASLDARNTFSRELRTRVGALPGVRAAGAMSHLPYENLPNWGGPYLPEGTTDASAARVADSRAISPGLLEALGATLIEGRDFTEDDTPKAPLVAIVDASLAARTWPGQSPLGKRLRADPFTSGEASQWLTVVGVVQHLRHRRPDRELGEQLYFPAAQAPRNPMAYAVRADGDPSQLAPAIRDAVRPLDPTLPVYDVRLLDEYVAGARATRRFTMTLAAAFAAVAVLLACIGVYGVTAYGVALRRQEFGVRMALGARTRQIVGLVLREGRRLTAAGLALGACGAAAVAALLRSQLFGISPLDPATYVAAFAVLATAAMLACFVPAARAVRTRPLDALRD